MTSSHLFAACISITDLSPTMSEIGRTRDTTSIVLTCFRADNKKIEKIEEEGILK